MTCQADPKTLHCPMKDNNGHHFELSVNCAFLYGQSMVAELGYENVPFPEDFATAEHLIARYERGLGLWTVPRS
jgi:hypothetical protein